jgi:hypothetical protein
LDRQENSILKGGDVAEELKRDKLLRELEIVRQLDEDGLLRPEKAVAWARQHRESALYKHIDNENGWNDKIAAEKFRVELMRQVIRVVVTQIEHVPVLVRAFISVPSDRTHGGGYRPIAEALARSRQEIVNEAVKELTGLKGRYTHVPELDPLWKKVEEVARGFQAAADSDAA